MPSLYALSQEHARLETLLTETAGEWTDEVEAAFNALELGERDRVDSYHAVVSHFLAHAEACQNESKRLAEKADVAANTAKRLKERLKEYMELRGVTELKGDIWKAVIQKNGGVRKLTLLVPVGELPPAFTQYVVTADTEAMRDTIGEGNELYAPDTGVVVARLEPAGSHLRFR